MRSSFIFAYLSTVIFAAAVPVYHETPNSASSSIAKPPHSSKPLFTPYTPLPSAQLLPSRTPASSSGFLTSTPAIKGSLGAAVSSSTHISKRVQTTSPTSSSFPMPTWDNTCPAHKSKMCCQSIDEAGDQLTSGLGTIVPYVSGIKISSILGFSCKPMTDSEPEENCADSVMCCSGNAQKSDLFKTCEMFDKAVQKKNEKAYSSALAAASATPSPTSTSG